MGISSAAYDSLSPTNLDNFTNPLRLPGDNGLMGIVDAPHAPLHITTGRESVEVLPRKRGEVSAYRVQQDGKTYVNPTFRVQAGADFSAELANELDEETTIHWHGLHVDWRMDGHPLLPVAPDATYRYAYPVQNRGGTDIPLLIQDKMLDEDGKFVYAPGPMEEEMGYEGDVVLANLTPNPYLEVATRVYRFRLLNGSNARNLRLAFSKAGEDELLPYEVIATDGSLLERPVRATEVFLSPAERVDALVNLMGFEDGEEIVLRSLPFDPMHNEHDMEMAGHMEHMDHHHHMGPTRLPDGHGFYVLKLAVTERVDYVRRIPETLAEFARRDFTGASVRPITLSMESEGGTTRWLINGLTHDMDEYPIVARRGAKEVWEVHNEEKSMPHPMHLHGYHFRVLGRTGSPEQVSRLAMDEAGRTVTDLGYKDTVLVWPGETVSLAIDFSHSYEGEQLCMFHCHILEHENAGMMLNVKVVSGEA